MNVDTLSSFGYGEGGDYMPADTVEEQASDSGMRGPASVGNILSGRSFFSTPTRALVAVWFVALAAYWFCGWFFRGARS